jgi:hypothetical protein
MTKMKRVILILTLLVHCALSFSQKEVEIYNWIFINYIQQLKQPNIDYSSGTTLTVLKRANYMRKLDTIDYTRFKEKYDKLEYKTFINFIHQNKLDLQSEKIGISGVKVVILENESIPRWSEIISKYPNWIFSIIEFSNIGFNEAKDQALVYYGFDSGPGVGGGFYVVFEKKKRKWKQKGIIPAWAA